MRHSHCILTHPLATALLSSASRSSSEDETEYELPHGRGRPFPQTNPHHNPNDKDAASPTIRRSSPHIASSGDSTASSSGVRNGRTPFIPPSSPAKGRLNLKTTNTSPRHMSPSISRASRQKVTLPGPVIMMPARLAFRKRLPFTLWTWSLSIDTRKSAESFIIAGSVFYGTSILTSCLSGASLSGLADSSWVSSGDSVFFYTIFHED